MSKGNLIVIEGAGDGVGKSTQLAYLNSSLDRDGIEYKSTHFPSYGTFHGASVEAYLNGDLGTSDVEDAYYIASLYGTDRATAMRTLGYKDYYDEGNLIICDRYTTSSLIYQSARITDKQKKIDFINFVVDCEYNKWGVIIPDKTIFLDASIELMKRLRLERQMKNNVEADLHEKDDEFLNLVYYNAQFIAEYLNWTRIPCEYLGKLRSISDIHDDVYEEVLSLIKK